MIAIEGVGSNGDTTLLVNCGYGVQSAHSRWHTLLHEQAQDMAIATGNFLGDNDLSPLSVAARGGFHGPFNGVMVRDSDDSKIRARDNIIEHFGYGMFSVGIPRVHMHISLTNDLTIRKRPRCLLSKEQAGRTTSQTHNSTHFRSRPAMSAGTRSGGRGPVRSRSGRQPNVMATVRETLAPVAASGRLLGPFQHTTSTRCGPFVFPYTAYHVSMGKMT